MVNTVVNPTGYIRTQVQQQLNRNFYDIIMCLFFLFSALATFAKVKTALSTHQNRQGKCTNTYYGNQKIERNQSYKQFTEKN